MAGKEIPVTIKRRGEGCDVSPKPFRAQRGDFVAFESDEPGARITFDGKSPFAKRSFEAARMPVRGDALVANDYRYLISWADGGTGDGTGEIRP